MSSTFPLLPPAFTVYPPLHRVPISATRGSPRRPSDDPSNDPGHARSSRPSNPSSNPSFTPNSRNSTNRARNPVQRRHSQQSQSSSADLFSFFDSEHPESANLEQQQSRGRGGRRGQLRQNRRGDDEIGSDLEEEENGEVDDAVDDGFYTKYRRGNNGGHRLTDFSSLDADEGGREASLSEDRNERNEKRMDRQTAANAFDAVDKLFGSMNASAREGPQKRLQRRGRGGRGGINRERWLSDVRARAATKEDRRVVNDKTEDEIGAVDVDAVVDLSEEGDDETGFEEAGIRKTGAEDVSKRLREPNASIQASTQKNAQLGNRYGNAMDTSERSGEGTEQEHGETEGANERNRSGMPFGSQPEISFSNEESFQNLMNIARKGPNRSTSYRRKDPRQSTASRQPQSPGSGEESTNGKRYSAKRGVGRDRQPREERRVPPNSEVLRLLGLTKQIRPMRNDATSSDIQDEEAGYVSDEEDVSENVQSRRGMYAPQLQTYTNVRRVGGRAYRIFSTPEEWKPVSDEEVAQVRSDNRPLGRNKGRGKDVITDCRACRASGLESCIACLGNGWIPPLAHGSAEGPRRALLVKMWNRPNLVVDSRGEAQCVNCNGIGKQLCSTCKGSGSADKIGFNIADMREVFDIFPDVEEFFLDEDMAENGLEGDEVDEDDMEEFQLYTGEVEEVSDNDDEKDDDEDMVQSDVNVVDEGMEVEDESAELKAALEAMHLADIEFNEGPFIDRIRRRDIVDGEDNEDDVDEDLIVGEMREGEDGRSLLDDDDLDDDDNLDDDDDDDDEDEFELLLGDNGSELDEEEMEMYGGHGTEADSQIETKSKGKTARFVDDEES